jgi:PAS domain S-box-containing protein
MSGPSSEDILSNEAEYHIRALVATAEARAAGLPLDHSLLAVLDIVLDQMAVSHGFVATLDPGHGTLSVRVTRGLFEAMEKVGIERGSGLIGRVWASGDPVFIDDYETWAGRGIDLQAVGTRALMLVPLHAGDEVIGILGLGNSRPDDPFGSDATEALRGMCGLLVLLLLDDGVVLPRRTPSEPGTRQKADDSRLDLPWPVLDLVPSAIWWKDRENRVLGANLAAAASLGLDREKVVGQYLWELDPENAAHAYRADLEVLEEARPHGSRLEERVEADGSHHWWSVDRAPLLGGQDEVMGVLVVAKDVTEDHAVRTRLEESRRAADRANRVQGHYLAAMTHQVRLPLQQSLAAANELLRGDLDEEQTRAALEIERASDDVLALVQDLLDFSRVEAGNLGVEVNDLRLSRVVEDVLDVLAQDAHRRGVELAFHIDPDVPAVLAGDAERVRQILVQLLAHGVRACRDSDLLMVARLTGMREGHCDVRFEIRATEWSMGPAELASVFEPLLRGTDGLAGESEFQGLGLALAHRLVELLGGEVGVDRSREEGFGCWVTIPFRSAILGDSSDAIEARWQGARVLVVEDRRTIAAFLRRKLEDLGFAVDVAMHTRDAREMLAAADADGWLPALVIADDDLIDVEFATAAGERLVRVVPFGASAAKDSATGFLTKPVRTSRLRELLEERLGGERPGGAETTPRSAGGRRVLVVDEERLDQKLVTIALQRLGCEAEAVATVQAAVQRLEAAPAELVLVDMDMIREDGEDAALGMRRAQAEAGYAPIVGLVRKVTLAERERCLAAGMDGCLAKPPRYDELRQLLRARGRLPVL